MHKVENKKMDTLQAIISNKQMDLNLPKLPWKTLCVTMVAGLAAVATFIFMNLKFNQEQVAISDFYKLAEKTVGDIRYYDAELTNQARVFVITGDSVWIQRYDVMIPKLMAALELAKKIATPEASKAFAESTNAANDKLYNLELVAIKLTKEGKREDAIEKLFGDTYQNEKKKHALGSDAYFKAIDKQVAGKRSEIRARSKNLVIYTVIGFLIFIGLCMFFATALLRWNRQAITLLDQFKAEVATRQSDAVKMLDQLAIAKSHEADAERSVHMADICTEFDSKIKNMLKSITHGGRSMVKKAGDMKSEGALAAEQSANANNKVLNTKSAVENMAAATEEMSASISEINQLVIESKHITQGATKQVGGANEKMSSLTHAASRIGEISHLITDITSRTNLLALNATIEAARAGESGRGFAVVANEVKSLAKQTASATDEIGGLIIELHNATKDSMDAVKQISTTISDIDIRISTLAAAMQQQNNATIDMATNAVSAQNYVHEFERFVSSTNSSVTKSNDYADNLNSIVENVTIEFDQLALQIKQFLGDVRAA